MAGKGQPQSAKLVMIKNFLYQRQDAVQHVWLQAPEDGKHVQALGPLPLQAGRAAARRRAAQRKAEEIR